MNANFGQIFQCPLVNQTVTAFPMPIDKGREMRILLISDTHLGATGELKEGLAYYMSVLSELVKSEGITHICHLGDLVDGTLSNGSAVLAIVLKQMATLKIPVFAIGGNHDREFFAGLRMDKDPYVTPLSDLAILVEAGPDRVFLAHDLGNNYRVRDQFAFSFVSWIKNGCQKHIKPTDWLVTGHTHTGLISHASRVACVGQFSPPIDAYGYGLLEVKPTGIVINTKYMVGKKRA